MRFAITGASGLIGSALHRFLVALGHEVVPVVRRPPAAGEAGWDPEIGRIDLAPLEGLDGVVHLAGENIATRWTEARLARIRRSRVAGTRLLAEGLARLNQRPRRFISASAIGFYGDRGDEILTEASPPGQGDLAALVTAWEAAAEPARQAGIPLVTPRMGIVLSPAGGALAKMLPVFRTGAGGTIGSGRQWISWLALDDAISGLYYLLTSASLQGPVNLVSPTPVTNREFTETLGSILSRPTVMAVPAFAIRLALGRHMADSTVLASTRCIPARLSEAGFTFGYPALGAALRHVLVREAHS